MLHGRTKKKKENKKGKKKEKTMNSLKRRMFERGDIPRAESVFENIHVKRIKQSNPLNLTELFEIGDHTFAHLVFAYLTEYEAQWCLEFNNKSLSEALESFEFEDPDISSLAVSQMDSDCLCWHFQHHHLGVIDLDSVPYAKRTERVCDSAMQQDPRNVRYLPESMMTPSKLRSYVWNDGWVFGYLDCDMRTLELATVAVSFDGNMLLKHCEWVWTGSEELKEELLAKKEAKKQNN
jgi:hypothetical protein